MSREDRSIPTLHPVKPSGISVDEDSDQTAVSIVDAVVITETRWVCPRCRTGWTKRGIHTGVLKTCRKPGCGAKFFLRGEDN